MPSCETPNEGETIVDVSWVSRVQAELAELRACKAELLAACQAALCVVGCYTLGSKEAAEKKPVEARLRAAIAKAERKD